MRLTRRTLLGALGASGVSAVCGIPAASTPPDDNPDGTLNSYGDPWITYACCEDEDGPIRVKGVMLGGARLSQEEYQIDLARGVLTRGPLRGPEPT